ncbi:MAG: hypothetical protein OXC44_08415 [Proteobacteria bacterium]|nr:hypothetical protein [Pseudomonadota bacterium]
MASGCNKLTERNTAPKNTATTSQERKTELNNADATAQSASNTKTAEEALYYKTTADNEQRSLVNRRLKSLLGAKVDLSCARSLPIDYIQVELRGLTASGKAIEDADNHHLGDTKKFMHISFDHRYRKGFGKSVPNYELFAKTMTFTEPNRKIHHIHSIEIKQRSEGYFKEDYWTLKSLMIKARDIVIYKDSQINQRFSTSGDSYLVSHEKLKKNSEYKKMLTIKECSL